MLPRKVWFVAVCCTAHASLGCADQSPSVDYSDLSLEQLGEVRVTSVSKRSERLADAPASIYVITEEAIRRSGVHSLPDALRLAPNLQVAQINAYQYAISARGFNSSTANKLLVLIDGRTIYTPLYSGVFWDAQDTMLQDIDRIEVISGPGGTLWGANAVNGVINIITKRSSATVGNLAYVTGGNTARGVAVRHGGTLAEANGNYRVYVKSDKWQHGVEGYRRTVPDAWNRSQMGFRTDWHDAGSDVTVQGDMYTDEISRTTPEEQRSTGGNLLARWEKSQDDGSSWRVQTYYDRTVRKMPAVYSERLDTLDLDAQYTLAGNSGKQTIVGGGYRFSDDHVGNKVQLAFLPAHRELQWGNLFAQQEWSFQPEIRLAAGVKLEYNSYTHVEFLPSLKLSWQTTDDKLLWAGLSRAVRAPSRIDSDLYAPGKAPYTLNGGPDFRSEIANTLDLGWRGQQGETFSYSLTAFYSLYDHLRSITPTSSKTYILDNQIEGWVNGLESWAGYQISKEWSIDAGALLMKEHFKGGNLVSSSPGNDPHVQYKLRSKWNINENQELDIFLRHVGKLPSPVVPAYTAVDVRYGWRISPVIEVALTGHDLFDPRHQEFASGSRSAIQIVRAIDLSLTARF